MSVSKCVQANGMEFRFYFDDFGVDEGSGSSANHSCGKNKWLTEAGEGEQYRDILAAALFEYSRWL